VAVEEVPWSGGKHQSIKAHMLFLDRWARKLSCKETAESVHTSWNRLCDADIAAEPLLKKSRWCVLKRKENLTSKQQLRLCDLLRYNLQTVRAHVLKKDFQQFWKYNSPTWAGMFLDFWCSQTMRSRID